MNDFFQEETSYSNKDKYPVFIVLTYGDNPLGMAIHKITGEEWTHSLIAFNPELDPMYSFATRTQKSDKPQSLFGFVYQNTKDNWYAYKETKYAVYVMFVNKAAITAMKRRLQYFIDHERESKYDFKGIFDAWAGKDTEAHQKYYCSRFVAEIIGQGAKLDRLPSLYHPEDLKNLDNVSLVNAGNDMYFYNPDVTKKNLEYIKRKKFGDVKTQNNQVFFKNKIISERDESIMNEKFNKIAFKEYARGIIDKEHYDLFTEALSSPKILGCKISYRESKLDKMTADDNANKGPIPATLKNSDKVVTAVGIFNSSAKMQKKISECFENTMAELSNDKIAKSQKDVNFNYFNKCVDVKMVEAVVGEDSVKFKCYAEPTSAFFKEMKNAVIDGARLKKIKGVKWFSFTLKIPLDTSKVTDDFIENYFISPNGHIKTSSN